MKRSFSKPSGRSGERERFRALLQSEGYRRNRDGELSNKDYAKFVTSTENNAVVDTVLKECKGDACKNGYAFSWDDIIQWISDHWWDILKIVLTVALLFLEPKPEDGDE
jgi:hypothetical protein